MLAYARGRQLNSKTVLRVENARVRFRGPRGHKQRWIEAVKGVSFSIESGETFCLVGESGSGKSTLARAIVGLLSISEGSITYLGDSESSPRPELVQMVFQDPASSLNPRRPLWWLVSEPAALRSRVSIVQRKELATRLLKAVGLDDVSMDRLPDVLSGGQRQRVAIARALSTQPKLLVLDEPTSALDVTIQAQVLDLLLDLQLNMGLTYLLITHNFNVVRHLGTHVAVMEYGEIVERGTVVDVMNSPTHSFTRNLMRSIPSINSANFLCPASE